MGSDDQTEDKDVADALEALTEGNCIVLADGQGGCSLAFAAQHARSERVAFVIRHSAGIVCAAMDENRLEGFGMHPAVSSSSSSSSSSYVAVDWAPGCTTGVSAKDRAATLLAFCDTSNSAASFKRPGHTFPVRVSKTGVLANPSRPEAAYDLCRLAGLSPVAALAEMMREDGEPTTGDDAREFCRQHGLPLVTVERLAEYMRRADVKPTEGAVAETQSRMWVDDIEAECSCHVFSTSDPKIEIVAVVKGDVRDQEAVPVRIHSECFTGDVLASQRCDCGQQLHKFMRIMNEESNGILLYVRGQEGRGIGLMAKIRAYKLQDEGHDTVDANLKLGLPVDTRTYDDALVVLRHFGLKSIRLFTNNPEKMRALQGITKQVVALASVPCARNIGYLKTKRERLNHRTVLETFKLPELSLDMSELRVGLVYTTWNQYYVDELRHHAEAELQRSGTKVTKIAVPGACELISGARAMLRQQKPDAIIAIGVLIRGSSDLYDATCSAVMSGLTELNASQDTPVVVGLLMCHDEDQAHDRSHGPSNPAKAWAETALHMASIAQKNSQSVPPSPVKK
eukprot:TRINITY_DN76578_c0_g1_i1.p1 TRINITY_DN76578_c0_g1~~TRINITY_DN76578_c0_g1_i1.p1  ORF type:complete len:568 (-),score=123.95 TRINITY_DN76578_c0_g1_i1:87-1790(-)